MKLKDFSKSNYIGNMPSLSVKSGGLIVGNFRVGIYQINGIPHYLLKSEAWTDKYDELQKELIKKEMSTRVAEPFLDNMHFYDEMRKKEGKVSERVLII
jgi:hypothetical protein